MNEAAALFDALFDGQPPRQFSTLQDAMYWVEDLECPTGTIALDGQAIIVYDGGSIETVE